MEIVFDALMYFVSFGAILVLFASLLGAIACLLWWFGGGAG
jgi:hypothetical protein